ncbi:bifunctional ADP-dependent NAD(P)H-hydrate dehydratase/NAD(P)H-hydrate epimerase [Photobacterium sp. J15]|uniref:bifunctional ADP-dependent NAD(P)H-hydrate dehydratase/NAD(P)H-hydrate epimerase n=1 Tax=Photobacterium sp. J15 TaxID=265901 RepID=UPI0007E3A0FC|nr:bifunctional ADP-dependent NAD(P)H-hydrate dehydratase/NAD(P)H-hydrate epimerase [Photobacterium sp. J15]
METSQLPVRLYKADQVRQGEQLAAKAMQLEMYQLMERAGQAVFDVLVQQFPEVKSLLVCSGGGNNGGDGYIVARLAREVGMDVILWQLGDAGKLTGDAALARDAWLASGGEICQPQSSISSSTEVVVDALLGTGLKGRVRGDCAGLIQLINEFACPVVAVDIPSGLCADTGVELGPVIRAEATVTFIGMKQGLCTGQAANYTGQLCFSGLGVEAAFDDECKPAAMRISRDEVSRCLPSRSRTAHKGDHGRVLCVGGDLGMAGAIRLASEACARCGAGLTAVITQPDNVLSIVGARPEIMAQGWQDKAHEITQRLDWADVVVIGPGLGQSDWSKALLFHFESTEKTMVVDADGLNLLALSPDYKNNRIITPHPGEAARLLGTTVAEVEADRFAAAQSLQQKFGGVVVLKGAGTLIYGGQQYWLCMAGNPGMATGGMGDVLSGIIGALAGQGLSLSEAARVGVWIHSTAADLCALEGERGVLASDLFPYIRQLVNPR